MGRGQGGRHRPWRGLTRRPRRGKRACSPMGRSIASDGDPKGVQGGNEGKTQGGLPLGNPVCLWQTELFKLNLKSSPSSSGYNRRRRLATRSSGKQQAGRTAVRTAPIVCPEESPQCARRRKPLPCPRRGLTRRLRRELGLAVPWGALLLWEAIRRGLGGTKGSGYPVDTTVEGG